MEIRHIQKQSIIQCIPPASEIAELRIANKDLNFIQAMVKRADDLTSQALSATDYTQLVTITDNFTKLAERSQVKAQTLKDLTSDENPLTGVNNSAELLEKVQLLAKTLEDKTQELSSLYNSNENSLFETYGNSISELSQKVDSISSPNDVISVFPDLETLLKAIDENARYINNSTKASDLVEKVEELSKAYTDKAEQYSDCLLYTSDAADE